MMHYYGSGWNTPHMYGFGFGFLEIIFWVFVVLLVVRVMNKSSHHMAGNSSKDAVDILKERYAKGEINKEQFESMKKDLKD